MVQQLKQRIKKLQPIIKVRRHELNKQTAALAMIRREKLAAINELKRYQELYFQGVDQLNKERLSQERRQLDALEISVDHAKNKWHETLFKIKELENKEKHQIRLVLTAEQRLKSLSRLEEDTETAILMQEAHQEQKHLDEIAINNSRRKQ